MSDIDKSIEKILNNFMMKEEGVISNNPHPYIEAIKQLMADEVKKAGIDELNRISADPGEVIPYKHDSFAMGMNFYQSRIADRIAELKGDDK